jgi:hypothetical protein
MAVSDAVSLGHYDSDSFHCSVSQHGLRTRNLYADVGLAARVRVEED